MRALITGASSGIGTEMAIYLDLLGYDLILVARNKDNLNEVKKRLHNEVLIYQYDLSIKDNCMNLYNEIKNMNIDIIINNAGCGVYGDYCENNLDDELEMINLNITCVHILTKLFINNKNNKYILNVASSAGFINGGPLMSSYYGTKSYVCNYSLGLYEELRRNKINKHIAILCPGPVRTNFNKKLKIKDGYFSMDAKKVAKYGIDMMFKNKVIIVPGFYNKLGIFLAKFIPIKILLRINYNIQRKKKSD